MSNYSSRLCLNCRHLIEADLAPYFDRRFCLRCNTNHREPNEDEYMEARQEREGHAAEDREAHQRAMGMLDGKGFMWWGNGRLMT